MEENLGSIPGMQPPEPCWEESLVLLCVDQSHHTHTTPKAKPKEIKIKPEARPGLP